MPIPIPRRGDRMTSDWAAGVAQSINDLMPSCMVGTLVRSGAGGFGYAALPVNQRLHVAVSTDLTPFHIVSKEVEEKPEGDSGSEDPQPTPAKKTHQFVADCWWKSGAVLNHIDDVDIEDMKGLIYLKVRTAYPAKKPEEEDAGGGSGGEGQGEEEEKMAEVLYEEGDTLADALSALSMTDPEYEIHPLYFFKKVKKEEEDSGGTPSAQSGGGDGGGEEEEYEYVLELDLRNMITAQMVEDL